MDLSDVMNAVIGGLDSSPPPMPTKPRDRAVAFYEDLCAYIATRGQTKKKPPIVDGLLRASCVSDVLEALPRIRTFSHRSQVAATFSKTPLLGEQMTYDIGHAIHDLWREEYLGPSGRLWGIWRCPVCGNETRGTLPMAMTHKCAGPTSQPRFVESYIEIPEHRLRGHPDGLLVEPLTVKPETLLEIKSTSSSNYDKLSDPEAAHMQQVHPYMRGFGVEEVLFIYVDKGKQTDWKWLDGRLRPVGKPRFKVYHRMFDDRIWNTITTGVAEFFALYDRMAAA